MSWLTAGLIVCGLFGAVVALGLGARHEQVKTNRAARAALDEHRRRHQAALEHLDEEQKP